MYIVHLGLQMTNETVIFALLWCVCLFAFDLAAQSNVKFAGKEDKARHATQAEAVHKPICDRAQRIAW